MKRRTKIVCTLGPAVDSREKVQALIVAGMNVARLNCSHGDWETKRRWVDWVRELSPAMGPVAVFADLQGPKFRLAEITGGSSEVVAGSTVTIGPGVDAAIPVKQSEIVASFQPVGQLLIADGSIELQLIDKAGDNWTAKVISGGTIKSRQGITLVGRVFDSPSMTAKDLADLGEAAACGVDYIALSYVKDAEDIQKLRKEVSKHEEAIRLCAKIETRDALKNLDAIAREADLVMVARGDMGLQMPLEEVPLAQKKIIAHCTRLGKPVITATQMLESMVVNPRPTRAEVTDVANAILDGTDAVMLSGETAAGAYPVEAVRMMVRVAERAETALDRRAIEADFEARSPTGVSHTEAVAHAVSELALRLRPAAILTISTSGQTPRLVSKFRPRPPILCATWSDRVCAQMAAVWGVEAVALEMPKTTEQAIRLAVESFVERKRVKKGDLLIVTAGVPPGVAGNTNMIQTHVA